MRTYVKVYSNELAHHGIKGMKWGIRRYQYEDGSLTPAGRKRYADDKLVTGRQAQKNANAARKTAIKKLNDSPDKHTLYQYNKTARKAAKESIANDKEYNRKLRAERKAAAKEKYDDATKAVTNVNRTVVNNIKDTNRSKGERVANAAIAVIGTKAAYNIAGSAVAKLGHPFVGSIIQTYGTGKAVVTAYGSYRAIKDK